MRKAVNIICGILAEVCALAVILLGLVVRLNVDVSAIILGRGAIEQALEVVRQVCPGLVVGVVIVCHFWPFS